MLQTIETVSTGVGYWFHAPYCNNHYWVNLIYLLFEKKNPLNSKNNHLKKGAKK